MAEVDHKVQDWLKAGALAVWVVSPRWRTITVYRSRTDIRLYKDGDVLDAGEPIAGFKLHVAESSRSMPYVAASIAGWVA